VVEIEGRTMRVTPVSYEALTVRNAANQTIQMPLVIHLP
jgi:hypothetical protein